MCAMDYARIHEEYWARPDRWGTHSFSDTEELIQRIGMTCGGGRLLDVGCGMGLLVRSLVRRGLDAQGIDVAQNAVEYGNSLVPGRFRTGSILEMPCSDAAFDTVVSTDVLACLEESDVPRALAEVYRVARRFVYAVIPTQPDRDAEWRQTLRDRTWWEARFFEAGFRRHPLMQSVVAYSSLDEEGSPITLVFEKVPLQARQRYPLGELDEHRALHMDMLRDTGRSSDAHIARYALACQYVRPGDVVLDAACGFGYGSAILAAGSPASKVLGVDNSFQAVHYAQECYGAGSPLIEFHLCDAARLSFLGPESVDCVVSFETLEHVSDPEALLSEFQRVLRPGGRVIVSVPDDWTDESGKDPTPHHLQVYTWGSLFDRMGRHFRIEKAYSQIAGGGLKLRDGRRVLREVSVGASQSDPAEWWLMVGMKDPVHADPRTYRETSFPDFRNRGKYNITAFDRDYDNPWLVKSMVSIGMRTTRDEDLQAIAEEVLASGRPGSADAGAAICVLAYRVLNRPDAAVDEIRRMLDMIHSYHAQADDTSHAWRWRLSNQYVAGHLWLAMGRRDEALKAFVECGEMDCLRFSPLLATKTVDAWFQAGLLAACDGKLEQARGYWTDAIRWAKKAVRANWLNVLGRVKQPVSFGLPEASQVLELASRAAYALLASEHWSDRSGWSWNQAFLCKSKDLEGWRRVATVRQHWIEHYQKEYRHMQATVATLQESLAAHQGAVAELRRQVSERDGLLAAGQGQISAREAEAQQKLSEKEQSLAVVRAELAERDAEIGRCRLQLEEKDTSLEAARSQLIAYEAEMAEIRVQSAQLRLHATETEKALTATRAELNETHVQLGEIQQQVAEIEELLAATQAEVVRQKSQLETTEKSLDAARAELVERGTEIAEYRSQAEASEQSLAAAQAELAAREADLVRACQAVDEKQALLAAWQGEAEQLQSRFGEQDRLLAATQAELVDKRAEAQRLFVELDGIYQSTGWALLRPLYRLRYMLFPSNSRRERAGKAMMHRIRGIRHALRRRSSEHSPAAPPPSAPAAIPAAPPVSTAAAPAVADSGLQTTAMASGKPVVALQIGSFDKGGLEEVVFTLARNLQEEGSVSVVVFVTTGIIGHLGEVARQHGIPVVPLNENASELRRLIRQWNVRLVNLHYTTFGVEEYTRAGIPIVYTIHNTYIWATPSFVSERLEAYRHVSHFIAVSQPVGDFFARRFGIDRDRITVVPNGLDLEYVAQEDPVDRASLGLSEDDVVFLNVASFNWHKAHVLMIAAMQRLIHRMPNAKLLLVGDTHDAGCRARAEQEIARRGLNRHIQILDYVPKNKVIGLMKKADCFLLPSLIEGWSIATLEAMYSGLPLILSDVGSARAVINDSDIGLIVRPPFSDIHQITTEMAIVYYSDETHLDNVDDLVTAMETIGRDRQGWKQRGMAGREKVLHTYSARNMCRQYLSCFHRQMPQQESRPTPETPAMRTPLNSPCPTGGSTRPGAEHVGVVMLLYNRSDVVIPCLQSLARARASASWELYLVDNASRPEEAEKVRTCFEQLVEEGRLRGQFVHSDVNRGFPGGNNLGIRYFVQREDVTHICLLNSDVVVTDFWLDRLLEKNVDAIGPVTNACGNEQTIPIPYGFAPSDDAFPTVNQWGQERYEAFKGCCKETDFLGFFCFLARAELYLTVGLLDERFGRGAFEDDDYCLRILAKGYRMTVARDVFIYHWGTASFSQIPLKTLRGFLNKNRKKFEAKHGKAWQDRSSLPLVGVWDDLEHIAGKGKEADVQRLKLYALRSMEYTKHLIHERGVGGAFAGTRGRLRNLRDRVKRWWGTQRAAKAAAFLGDLLTRRPILVLGRWFPRDEDLRDGYFQRVRLIDGNIEEHCRIYIKTQDVFESGWILPKIVRKKDRCYEIGLIKRRKVHCLVAAALAMLCRRIYVHSVMRFGDPLTKLMYNLCRKRILDLHGVVPEEFIHAGDEHHSRVFGFWEKFAVEKASMLVVVTQVLADHITVKYGDSPTRRYAYYPMLPQTGRWNVSGTNGSVRDGIIYCGSLFKWQQVDKMLDFVHRDAGKHRITFLVPQPDVVKQMYRDLFREDFPGTVSSAPSHEVAGWYASHSYGLILREKTIVNLAACPTKLVEYLQNGLVPIVECPDIGDFLRLGYRYVDVNQPLPEPAAYRSMAEANAGVLRKMYYEAQMGMEQIQGLLGG